MRFTVILIFIFHFLACTAQIDSVGKLHKQKEYIELFQSNLGYYIDSISESNSCFVTQVYIAEFDPDLFKLKIVFDYTIYYSIGITFNPTHMLEFKSTKCLIRFDDRVNSEIIRKLNFITLSLDDFKSLKEFGKACAEKNNHATGYTQSYIFEVDGNCTTTKWYTESEMAPRFDRVTDFDFDGSLMPYNDYLKLKLRKYND